MKRLRVTSRHVFALIAGAFVAIAATLATVPAHALDPSERLADQNLEQRARDLSAELRCLVCQNQSIDDSDAPLAKDLRRLVRERIVAGETDTQVKTFLVERYGDFVLLKPPFNAHTLLLWLTPVLVLGLIAFFIGRAMTIRRVAAGSARLSDEEERRLKTLLGSGDSERGA